MARQLKILEHALSALLRRKYKNLSLLVVYAFTVAALGSVLFLTQALKAEAIGALSEAPELVVQRLAAGRHDLIPTEYAETILALPGIEKVTPRVWGYYYDALVRANFTMIGFRDTPQNIELIEGRLPNGPDECAVGRGVTGIFGAEIGDRLVLIDSQEKDRLYEITGRFTSASSLLTNDLILMQEGALRDFFAMAPDSRSNLSSQIC